MLRMYEELARRWPRPTTAIALMDTSLAAHFCPFRSPDWNSLASRRESIEFSEALWRDVMKIVRPRAMICLGQAGPRAMTEYESPHGKTLIVQIPHLSRFRIFGRPESRQAIDRFTTAAANAAA
jgi:hypothetical protein